jgi:hypothetical protein
MTSKDTKKGMILFNEISPRASFEMTKRLVEVEIIKALFFHQRFTNYIAFTIFQRHNIRPAC